MSLSVGDRLGRYEILGPLGAGGMGEVYRAHDERLDRDVAIKVLPDAVAQNPDRLARFEREAKAVARLSHPSILEVYELGEHEGRLFMVTELLEGETLRERLEGGSLGWRKASEIGAAIADGIAAAHKTGIVHRDLKPSNVFITADGRVKVLDFGLARSLEVSDADESRSPTVSRYTEPGAVIGTVDYMAPEQVKGEPADHRTDIFALGCVLHEMVAGQRPFHRATGAETMAAILRDEPTEITSRAGFPPPAFQQLVRRCLEKRPGARYQSAGEVAVGLRTLREALDGTLPDGAPEIKSIAVLPFANLSPDPEQEFFSDGLTEEIITDLSKIGSLRVTSRMSAWKFKGSTEDIPTVAGRLGVRYVLQGSVRRAGDRLRITAQFIDAGTDAHLWAERFDGTIEDVFDMQEKVSRFIVDELKIRLTPDEDKRIAGRPTQDLRAYEAYLKARNEYFVFTEENMSRALEYLEDGVRVCGENALLLAGFGLIHYQIANLGFGQEDSVEKAEDYASRALQLDSESAAGHLVIGLVNTAFLGDQRKAVTHLNRALEIDPSNFDALMWLTWVYGWLGKFPAAERLVDRLQGIDPLNPNTWGTRVGFETYCGRLNAAMESSRAWLERYPEDRFLQDMYAWSHAYGGDKKSFRELVDTFDLEAEDYSLRRIALMLGYALEGDREGVDRLMDNELSRTARRDLAWSQMIADAFAGIGEYQIALDWFENALERGFTNYPFLAEYDPFVEGLRGTPEFEDFLGRVKYAWEHFEV